MWDLRCRHGEDIPSVLLHRCERKRALYRENPTRGVPTRSWIGGGWLVDMFPERVFGTSLVV